MKTFLVIVVKLAVIRGNTLKKRGAIIAASPVTLYKSRKFALENGPITPILGASTAPR
jgi:hypothetical protein